MDIKEFMNLSSDEQRDFIKNGNPEEIEKLHTEVEKRFAEVYTQSCLFVANISAALSEVMKNVRPTLIKLNEEISAWAEAAAKVMEESAKDINKHV